MLAQRRRQLRAGFKRAETGPTGPAEGDQSPKPVPSPQRSGRFRRVGTDGLELTPPSSKAGVDQLRFTAQPLDLPPKARLHGGAKQAGLWRGRSGRGLGLGPHPQQQDSAGGQGARGNEDHQHRQRNQRLVPRARF